MPDNAPAFVTFTGVDEATDVDEMLRIQSLHPVEWGVLFSPKRQGADRYPAIEFVRGLHGRGLNLAAHVCGGFARDVVATGRCETVESLPHGMFSRVQVNTSDRMVDPGEIASFAARIGAERGILQARGTFPEDVNVDWLHDCSGGRGIRPDRWPAPAEYAARVGYAGGIGPETVVESLAAIRAANPEGRPYWIDMEGRVRDQDDAFDLRRCLRVLELAYPAQATASA